MIINDWRAVADKRIAGVTGAGRGIGREYALALAGAGFAVADLNAQGAQETVALIEKDSGRAAAFTVDVSDPGLTFTEATESTVSEAARESMVARAAIPVQGRPADLISALLFLVDERSGWVTAQTIVVDGGLSTRL
jgi:NAD(P)-dependent dehydrogenase (short-subunit alcohol dehydrogenase family)